MIAPVSHSVALIKRNIPANCGQPSRPVRKICGTIAPMARRSGGLPTMHFLSQCLLTTEIA